MTVFPEAGLLDPVAGVRHYESEYTIRSAIGVPADREFMFDHSWEIVAGEWVFEFWQAGRKIGSESFCVLDAESAPHRSDPSVASCGFLIGHTEFGRGVIAGARGLMRGRARSFTATIAMLSLLACMLPAARVTAEFVATQRMS